MPQTDRIKHIVVLMLENRSFDHMLGGLTGKIPNLDGIDPNAPPRMNRDQDGKQYKQVPGASFSLKYDPKHEVEHVHQQLLKRNSGFVDDFSRAYPHSQRDDRAEIMKYFEDGQLPAVHTLAKNFGVCDRWFSSVPGPTWPNRFFAHSGTSLGHVDMPEGVLDANLHWYNQTTVYDRLNEKDVSWKIYYGDVPQSLMMVHQLEPHNIKNYCRMHQFHLDAAKPETFPEYCFIEPSYYLPDASDDHPPHDVLEGEKLIAEVYNALRRNEELWSSCLLVVAFDEHGGLYDHVVPPKAVPPDHYVKEFSFDQLGVRVPAILISPYVAKGLVHEQFDHTSILKYLTEKWDLGPLGRRVAEAKSIGIALQKQARTDAPKEVPLPTATGDPSNTNQYGQLKGRSQPPLNHHQSALVGMTSTTRVHDRRWCTYPDGPG